MNDSVLSRHTARKVEDFTASSRTAGNEPSEDLGTFGFLRGIKDRAVMLELRRKDGSITAIGYGWLEQTDYDPTAGITLWARGRKIELKGRHLNAEIRPFVRLFEGIVRHRVTWIREANLHELIETRDGGPVIDEITSC